MFILIDDSGFMISCAICVDSRPIVARRSDCSNCWLRTRNSVMSRMIPSDPVIVAALVKDNWTGIAKKELETNPLVGPLGKLMDAAFIDRADTTSAVAALAPIEEAARKGLSIVVAPEGTRLDTQSVGPFKKGAFRIAMATGLPVVPIVIRNSDSVAGRSSTTLNPGTVDVTVLPPVSTADWTVRDLQERIEEIRIAYVKLLAEWPAPGTAP